MLQEPPDFIRIPAWAIKLIIDTPDLERAAEDFEDDLAELWEELPRS
jgi:hypothetical protein